MLYQKMDSENYKYLADKIEILKTQPYFENIKKNSLGCFLLGIFNIGKVIDEHNLHIAVCTTKSDNSTNSTNSTNLNIKTLSKVLYNNTCGAKEFGLSEQFERYFAQFFDKNHPESYYKKYASVSPIDKLNDDLCQIVLEKDFAQNIAFMMTFQFIFKYIIEQFNLIALENNKIPIDNVVCETNTLLLLDLLNCFDSDENKHKILNQIDETINIFIAFFDEINNQFYCY